MFDSLQMNIIIRCIMSAGISCEQQIFVQGYIFSIANTAMCEQLYIFLIAMHFMVCQLSFYV